MPRTIRFSWCFSYNDASKVMFIASKRNWTELNWELRSMCCSTWTGCSVQFSSILSLCTLLKGWRSWTDWLVRDAAAGSACHVTASSL